MNYGDYLAELCEKIAQSIGIPKENALCVMRTQGNGAQLVTNRKGTIVAITAAVPFGGYIRQEGRYSAERGAGCATHNYTTICHAIVHERGGDSLRLADRVVHAVLNSNTQERIDLIDITRVYEEVAAEELADVQTLPTQGDLAVVRVRFSLSFNLLDCELSLPTCVVPTPAPPLPDALRLFYANTGITDNAIKTPTTKFYNTISTRSYFPKLVAFHPFVGGNANAHKYNLLDARDADDAYRYDFFGGWIHTANGVQGNGINAWANSHFSELGNVLPNSWNFGYYSRTNTGNIQWCDMGSFDGVKGSNIFPRVTIITNDRLYLRHGSGGAEFTAGATQTDGFYQINRVDTANIRARVRGSLVIQPTPYIGLNALDYSLGSLNNNLVQQFYSAREYGCTFFANQGFTDAETLDFHNDVTVYMTELGRNV